MTDPGRFVADLSDAAAALADVDTLAHEAAAALEDSARPRTPRRTGALAATVKGQASGTTATLTAGGGRVDYAPAVQGRTHWLTKAAADAQGVIADLTEAHTVAALSHVKD